MPKHKATDIAILKKHFRETDHHLELKITENLRPELKDVYENLMHTTWVPSDLISQIYDVIAKTVFPESKDSLRKIGQMAAQKSFTSVYKTFLKSPSVESIQQRIGMIWNTYHAQGKMKVEHSDAHSMDLILEDYPEVPMSLKQITMGHLSALFELAGVHDFKVTMDDSDLQAIRWQITWSESSYR